MQAVLTRKRFGCSASATSVEGSTFAVSPAFLGAQRQHTVMKAVMSDGSVCRSLGLCPGPILPDRTARTTSAPACATPISYLQCSAGIEVAMARDVARVVADGLGARARPSLML